MKKDCKAPGGKCISPKTCVKIGRCAADSKPKKPGQVTGKGGY